MRPETFGVEEPVDLPAFGSRRERFERSRLLAEAMARGGWSLTKSFEAEAALLCRIARRAPKGDDDETVSVIRAEARHAEAELAAIRAAARRRRKEARG